MAKIWTYAPSIITGVSSEQGNFANNNYIGFIYLATDTNTWSILRDDGVTWDSYSLPGGGGGSGMSRVIASVASNITAGAAPNTDYVYFVTATSTITLPTAVSNTNRYSFILLNSGVTLTLATTAGQTIDGQSTQTYNQQYQSFDVVSNNANWGLFYPPASNTPPNIILNIANRGEVPFSNVNMFSNFSQVITRRKYMCMVDSVSQMQLVYSTYQVLGSNTVPGETSPSTAPLNILAAYIEYTPAGSSTAVSDQITWNTGQSGVSVPQSTIVKSDLVSLRNGNKLTKGQEFYIRFLVNLQGTTYLTDGSNGTYDQALCYLPANENGQVSGTGTLTSPTGAVTNFPITPLLVAGLVPATTKSYIGMGDSIAYQGNDIFGAGATGIECGGYLRRFGYVKKVPYMSYAIAGKFLASMVNPATNNPLLKVLLSYSSVGICEYGVNDIIFASGLPGNTGSVFATMKTNYTNLYSFIRSNLSGIAELHQTTITPNVSSTDNNTTLANQTPNSGFTSGSVRDQINLWFKTQVAAGIQNGYLKNVLDIASVVEAPTDKNKWNATLEVITDTLSAAYSGGNSIQTNGLLPYGTSIVISPTLTPSIAQANVISSTPVGTGGAPPITTGLTQAPGVNASQVGGSYPIGTTVQSTISFDGTHPDAWVHERFLLPYVLTELQ